MPHKFQKYNIILDENFPPRTTLKRLNSRYNLKHLKQDLNKGGISDPEVYKLATELKRILVTFNEKDFKDMASKSKETGIIGVSAALSNEQIDKKLTAYFSKCTHNDLYGKFHMISQEINV